MRILCLHGRGTNSKIFQAQTGSCVVSSSGSGTVMTSQIAALRIALGEPHLHTFEFIEGDIPWKPAPELSSLLQTDTECFAYYDPSEPSTITRAINDLSTYTDTEGPFDGAIGFSQGAVLIALLLARDTLHRPFSFAIFICGGPPYNEGTVGDGRQLEDLTHPNAIKLPTAHIVGSKDVSLKECWKLVDVCDHNKRLVLDHGGGHEVPTKGDVTARMVEVIRNVMAAAQFAQ